MSAREEFENWLKKWDVGHSVALPEKIQAMLDEHAHELAETLRREADEADISGSPATPDVIYGVNWAADWIDPAK